MEPLHDKKDWRNRPPTVWQAEEGQNLDTSASLLPCQHPECLAAQKRADQARQDAFNREQARLRMAVYTGVLLLSGLVYGLGWFAWYLIWGKSR